MPYADFPHPDAPILRYQASGSYAYTANGEALGLANTRQDYSKIGPITVIKWGPGDYRAWVEMLSLAPNFGGPTSYAGQIGLFDSDTVTGYLTSSDAVTWTARDTGAAGVPDPIIHPNCSPGSTATDWMRGESSPGTVLWDPSAQVFKCWGHGGNNTGPRAIWYATSADGITSWAFGNSGAAVLSKGAGGAWDDGRVADCRVVQISPTSYVMLYRGTPASGNPQIGRATSSDGISWTKTGTTPILASGTGWEAFGVYTGGLIYEPQRNQLHFWYAGDNAGDNGGQALGYAWSDDLGVTWTKSPLNPVITPSAAGLDKTQLGDTIFAYRDGTEYRISWGTDSSTGMAGYFRGRIEGHIPAAPLSPTFVAAGAGAWTATNGATFSPGLPTGWAVDDILLLVLHASNNDTFASLAGSGWTKRSPSAVSENNTAAQHVEVWWKRAVAGETAPSCSLTTNSVTIVRGGMMVAVRFCPTNRDPFMVESRLNNAASAIVNVTNISSTAVSTLGIFAYAYEDDPTSAVTPNGPTDQGAWQPFAISTSSLGTDAAIGFSHRKWGPIGSYSTPSTAVNGGTFANSPNVGMLFSLEGLPVEPLPPSPARVIRLQR